jgi:hypothetical protein
MCNKFECIIEKCLIDINGCHEEPDDDYNLKNTLPCYESAGKMRYSHCVRWEPMIKQRFQQCLIHRLSKELNKITRDGE